MTGVTVEGPPHRGRSLPMFAASSGQLLRVGPQQHLVPRLEHPLDPARVQLHLALLSGCAAAESSPQRTIIGSWDGAAPPIPPLTGTLALALPPYSG